MAETRREQLLYSMLLNVGTAVGEIQECLLGVVDSPAFDDNQKREVLRHNETIVEQLQELMARVKEYRSL